jgi:branched-chain amino acid transport system substrate-binding protein
MKHPLPFKKVSGSVLGLWLFSAISLGICGQVFAAESTGPIKLGLLLPYTGVYAKVGEDIDKGVKYFLTEQGSMIAGRKVELITEDTQSEPRTGVIKVRKLLESDKVDAIIGPVSSGVGMAVRDIVIESGVPQVYAIPGTLKESGEPPAPNIFRVSFSPVQIGKASAMYLHDKLKYRKMVLLGPDYVWGRAVVDAFKKSFEELGGKVVQVIYPPLGSPDYAPFLSQIKPKEADAAWVFFAGGDAIRFVKQYADYGLKEKLPLTAAGDLVDESFLPAQGEAAKGIISLLSYTPSRDSGVNQKFVEGYSKLYKTPPGFFSELGYVAAKVIAEGAKAQKGNTSDKKALSAAMQKARFEAPRGLFRFDENRFAIEDMGIRRVETNKEGKLVNTVFDVIRGIDSKGQLGR